MNKKSWILPLVLVLFLSCCGVFTLFPHIFYAAEWIAGNGYEWQTVTYGDSISLGDNKSIRFEYSPAKPFDYPEELKVLVVSNTEAPNRFDYGWADGLFVWNAFDTRCIFHPEDHCSPFYVDKFVLPNDRILLVRKAYPFNSLHDYPYWDVTIKEHVTVGSDY
jgi:hypothetical protein